LLTGYQPHLNRVLGFFSNLLLCIIIFAFFSCGTSIQGAMLGPGDRKTSSTNSVVTNAPMIGVRKRWCTCAIHFDAGSAPSRASCTRAA
jgi:hypothetical protein